MDGGASGIKGGERGRASGEPFRKAWRANKETAASAWKKQKQKDRDRRSGERWRAWCRCSFLENENIPRRIGF